jgi:hypothetical protein
MTRLLQLDKIGNGGRLGNQLFTIASCIGLALRHGYTPRINEGWKYRADFPNIPDEWFGPIVQGKPLFERVYEYDEGIDYHLSTRLLNSTLIGYLQSPYYWAGNENIIRRYLTPKGCNPGSRDAVAVHYRRGDYVGNPNYVQLGYYHYLLGAYKLGIENTHTTNIIARSDDAKFIKSAFNQTCGTELDDFIALAECKEHIISNSTFAWWAAYLSGGKVVAPKEWFAGELSKRCSTKDLLPQNWILI